MLKSKIHRATVTQADLHYVGSVTIDADLMDAADLLEGEQVTIVDIDNGARLVTYAITGQRGSGVIGINGAAAHLVHPGDLVILIAYAQMEDAGVRTGIPLLVDNPKEVGADRIVNCLAAFQKYNTAAIVIDFGSSICVDVVSAKGEFLGGAIAPGIQVSSDAAAARSAALRRVELARPRSVVGKNTVEWMQAGAGLGFAGLVDGLVNRIREDVEGFADDDV